jgi:hypothetical protein
MSHKMGYFLELADFLAMMPQAVAAREAFYSEA